METTEKIVEAYVRYVKGWATIPNVRCEGQREIDLIAIDPVSLDRYHIETSVSGSQAYSKLTANDFDPALLKQRVEKAKMRRTVGYFIGHKFGSEHVAKKLREYLFEPGKHAKVVVTWGWTNDALKVATEAGIDLWDFREMLREIAKLIHNKRTYFNDETLRTINLFVRALEELEPEDDDAKPGVQSSMETARRQAGSFPYWVYRNWIHQRARLHQSGCQYCNNGIGTQGAGGSTATGEWTGFISVDDARQFLRGTGYENAKECGTCQNP